MISYDERGVIEDVELFDKDVILCDVCGRRVAVTERDPDEGLPITSRRRRSTAI